MEDSQRLSEHVRWVHDTLEAKDIEYILDQLDSWACEIRQLEDKLDRCERAVANLGGKL